MKGDETEILSIFAFIIMILSLIITVTSVKGISFGRYLKIIYKTN